MNEKPLDSTNHLPVMITEVLHYLNPKEGEHFLDCTFGAGGFSSAILHKAYCYLTAIDQDPGVTIYAEKLIMHHQERFNFVQANFADLISKLGGQQFDGIVADLGVSSMQLDNGKRGFSFMQDGPLDMRMNQTGQSAAEFINTALEEQIAEVIYRYGDESASRKIARKIVEERKLKSITTTTKLAEIVRSCIGFKKGKIDQATKTFQGIRIHINNELQNLQQLLSSTRYLLKPNGRLIILSFHSLEDRIVKRFLRNSSFQIEARSKYATPSCHTLDSSRWLKTVTKKPVMPSLSEIRWNPRSRSAKLRVAIKMGK